MYPIQWYHIENQQSPFYVVNRGTLNHKLQTLSHSKALSLNRHEIDFLNEVLRIYFGQEAANISEVKFGVKKYLTISSVRAHAPWVSRIDRYFFQPPTLTSDIFAVS